MSITFQLPARAFTSLIGLVLGDFARTKEGIPTTTKNPFLGLLGAVLEVCKWALDLVAKIGRSMTYFLSNHHKAIASAFWISALVGGAAALTVAFWPAALATLTSLSILGYSIASLVGTGFAAQVAAIGGVAAVVASATVYSVAAIANFASFIKGCFSKKSPEDEVLVAENDESFNPGLNGLGGSDNRRTQHMQEQPPIHTGPILQSPTGKKSPTGQRSPIVETAVGTTPQSALGAKL